MIKRFILIGLVLGLATLSLAPFVLQVQPRGIIRSVPLPAWLESVSRQDALAYRFHASMGTALNWAGAPPVAAASEWFKAAWHARSFAQIDAAANGLAAANRRGTAAELEASLCPFVSEWSDTTAWGSRGRQLAALGRADLTCGDQSTVFGEVPDDVPIMYATNPPVSGLYHQTWYPTFGVASVTIPPAVWVHNLAHGEIVLLYNCPAGCPAALAQAQELQANLQPGRNSRGSGARMIVTRYDSMAYPFALVAWGQLLPLEQFDADRIADFYADHVDRGIECRNLAC